MIITFNARENHHKGKEVIEWYRTLPQSEKSRKIIDILYAHILSGEHSINYDYDKRFRGGNYSW